MYQTSTRKPACRRGFTLIELLIVIAIIGVLVSLISGAVVYALRQANTTTVKADIAGMEQALSNAKQALNGIDYLPSRLKLSPTGNYPQAATPGTIDAISVTALYKMFGKNLNLAQFATSLGFTKDVILEGQELLVFYLGGVPASSTVAGTTTYAMMGFSTSPTNPGLPVQTNGESRKGPYFNFKSSRLQPSANGFLHYLDSYDMPYAYFSSYAAGNDYSADCPSLANVIGTKGAYPTGFGGIAPTPYYTGKTGAGVFTYVNPKGVQIISAGEDKTFGAGGLLPASGSGADDWANFSRTALGKWSLN